MSCKGEVTKYSDSIETLLAHEKEIERIQGEAKMAYAEGEKELGNSLMGEAQTKRDIFFNQGDMTKSRAEHETSNLKKVASGGDDESRN